MKTISVVSFCIQVCLVQNVFSQCTSRAAVAADPGLIAPGLAPYGLGASYGLGAPIAYDALPGWGSIAPAAAPLGYRAGIPEIAYPAAAGMAPFGYRAGLPELAYPAAAGLAAPLGAIAPYGGVGEGNVAVAGELPVVGNTLVAGEVPIMGAVSFGGPVPAAGSVSIGGQCSCGFGGPYEYFY